MANDFDRLDWSLVQSFLAVAEAGSLSGAAAALGQSQPTIGRHVAKLEAALGLEVFQRHPRGLALTPAGQELVGPAEAMRAAVADLGISAERLAGRPEGTVRLAASVFAAHHVMPPLIAALRAEAPEMRIVLRPSDDSDNLTFREADIAIRMYRPRQPDLVTRHMGDLEIGIFAACSYLARRGRPVSATDLLAHDLVGLETSTLIVDGMATVGVHRAADDFAVRCDHQPAYWELVRAGCGIGFTQAHVGRADPTVEELRIDGIRIASLPVWLTAQEDVRRIPRVARVWDHLARALPAFIAATHDGGSGRTSGSRNAST
jgi:DNA-binding transcriptional LysR family regulator